ncbi:hypothetical protein ACIBCM_19785 [Streptomyces sp. NPDC051018]|uniref:hypothetical protein n=1 Tax=Streptomyces sp. NPDC051018 TaxID=3365639 RepID=UPI0037B659E8
MTRVPGLVRGWAGALAVVAGVMSGTAGCLPPSMDPAVSVDPIERLGRKAVHSHNGATGAGGARAGGARPGPGGGRSGGSGAEGALSGPGGEAAMPGPGAEKAGPGAGETRPGDPGPPAYGSRRTPVRKATGETAASPAGRSVHPRAGTGASSRGMRAPALTESTTRLLDRIHRVHRVRDSPAHPRRTVHPSRPGGRVP